MTPIEELCLLSTRAAEETGKLYAAYVGSLQAGASLPVIEQARTAYLLQLEAWCDTSEAAWRAIHATPIKTNAAFPVNPKVPPPDQL